MLLPESSRLCFRELTNDDYADVSPLLLDDEVMRKMSVYVSDALVRRWLARKLEQYRRYGYSHWHVSLKATGEFIGIIGIVPEIVEGVEYTGVGYLIRPEHQRRGYAFEGAQACISWAFRNLRPDRIVAEIDETNLPSIRLAEKLGMVCERTYLRFNGETEVPHLLYSLSSGNFCPKSDTESY